MTRPTLLLAAAALALPALPALATGKMTCDVPAAQRKPQEELVRTITAQGWQVRKAKLDGGCYEVYGTTPEGDRVEAYFHPVTFEKLLVSRRGEILYRKP
jgi:hypothetical protein